MFLGSPTPLLVLVLPLLHPLAHPIPLLYPRVVSVRDEDSIQLVLGSRWWKCNIITADSPSYYYSRSLAVAESSGHE